MLFSPGALGAAPLPGALHGAVAAHAQTEAAGTAFTKLGLAGAAAGAFFQHPAVDSAPTKGVPAPLALLQATVALAVSTECVHARLALCDAVAADEQLITPGASTITGQDAVGAEGCVTAVAAMPRPVASLQLLLQVLTADPVAAPTPTAATARHKWPVAGQASWARPPWVQGALTHSGVLPACRRARQARREVALPAKDDRGGDAAAVSRGNEPRHSGESLKGSREPECAQCAGVPVPLAVTNCHGSGRDPCGRSVRAPRR